MRIIVKTIMTRLSNKNNTENNYDMRRVAGGNNYDR